MTNTNEWEKRFIKRFTDEIDAENNYYDAQFLGKPCDAIDFISTEIEKSKKEEREELIEELRMSATILGKDYIDSLGKIIYMLTPQDKVAKINKET